MHPTPKLFFIRHGETDWNAVARLQGQQDIPLNRTGEKQAIHCGHLLKSLVNIDLSMPFIASPMRRTVATMRLMREAAGLDPDLFTIDDRLKEISFGRWEGLTWKEVRRTDPRQAAGREADKWGFVPPGGESYQMLLDRIALWYADIAEDSVIVAHGGVARALLVHIGGETTMAAPKLDIWQGRILLFEDGHHRWIG